VATRPARDQGAPLLADLAAARERAAALGQELRKAERRLELMQLRAPVDGHVQELAATTIGGVVMPAQQLMIIVPADSGLEVEAFVLNKDIGFVQPGQEVQIKVQTFNFTRYGLIAGKVLDISDDVITRDRDAEGPAEPTYAARIALDRTTMEIDGREVNLSPGMAGHRRDPYRPTEVDRVPALAAPALPARGDEGTMTASLRRFVSYPKGRESINLITSWLNRLASYGSIVSGEACWVWDMKGRVGAKRALWIGLRRARKRGPARPLCHSLVISLASRGLSL
jgi:hypothetical protein